MHVQPAETVWQVGVVVVGVTALLVWLAVAFLRDPSRAMVILAGLLIAPIFLRIDGTSIHLGDALYPHNSGQTFPVGVLAAALVVALSFLKTFSGAPRWRCSPLAGPVAALVIVNLLVLLIGQVQQSQIWGVAFYLQTVAPMFCFFVAVNYVRSIRTIRAILLTCATVMGMFVLALIGFTLVRNGVGSTISDGLYWLVFFLPIYSTFDYFPLVVTIACALGLAFLLGAARERGKIFLAVPVAAMFVSVFLLHSRGALLTLALAAIVQLALFASYAPSRRRAVIAAAACAVLAIVSLAGPESLTNAYLSSNGDPLEYGLSARTSQFALFSREILDYPLTGREYIPLYAEIGTEHLGNPHDQYLTYALRGGMVSLFLFLFALFVVNRHLVLARRRATDPLENSLATGLLSVLLSVALVSNLFQDNFTQPYSGLLLWFLIGVGEALYMLNRRNGVVIAPTGNANSPPAG